MLTVMRKDFIKTLGRDGITESVKNVFKMAVDVDGPAGLSRRQSLKRVNQERAA